MRNCMAHVVTKDVRKMEDVRRLRAQGEEEREEGEKGEEEGGGGEARERRRGRTEEGRGGSRGGGGGGGEEGTQNPNKTQSGGEAKHNQEGRP